MVDISPIRALFPSREKAPELVSHPYDVMDRDEARQMASGKQASYLRIIRSDLEFENDVDPYSEPIYKRAAANLENFIKQNWLIRETNPCYYIYRLNSGNIQQTGLVAGSSILDYEKDKIKKHEYTRPEKEKDRTTHIDQLGANTGPVFLLYQNAANQKISQLLDQFADNEKPLYDLTFDDDVRHRIYRIEPGPDQDNITKLFSTLEATYIADGHHRAASACVNGKKRLDTRGSSDGSAAWKYFLTVIFPDNQLEILPYNRVVEDLNGLSIDDFLDRIKNHFSIKDGKQKIEGPYDINMYLDGKWYALQALPESYEGKNETDRLAVSVLQDMILAPVLNIEDPRTSDGIQFIGGVRGDQELEKLVNSNKFAVAFSMPPVATSDLISIADAGHIMPPKSTWFEPKLRSGFITHVLDDDV